MPEDCYAAISSLLSSYDSGWDRGELGSRNPLSLLSMEMLLSFLRTLQSAFFLREPIVSLV